MLLLPILHPRNRLRRCYNTGIKECDAYHINALQCGS